MQGKPDSGVAGGNTLGRYRIVREIARSNDIVYEATDPVMGRRVAVKELQMPPNLAGSQRRERIDRFYREARAAGALTHAGIVTIYEVGEERGRHFIAMEYLEGESLRDRLQRQSALPAGEALRIALAVAEGLQYAHDHGVIHRDVKPDNVHLLPDGRVKITDFGIARITFEPTLTADGQIFGTPSYMSPEQVRGGPIDARSDIFSLGVMLYEMLAGRKPFTGDSVITITYNIVNMNPSPLAGIPPHLDAIIRRAMAKDPSRRFASSAEMGAELRRAASGAPPSPLAGRPPVMPAPPRPAVPAPGYSLVPPRQAAPAPIPRPVPQQLFPVAAPPGRMPQRAGMPPPGRAAPPVAYPAPPPPMAAAAPRYAPVDPMGMGKPVISAETRWLLGWLGIAVVIGLIVLLIAWSFIRGYEGGPAATGAGPSAAAGTLTAQAQEAVGHSDFRRAWQLYKQAVDRGEKPREQLLWNAAICAVNWADEQRGADTSAAEAAANEALRMAPDYGPAYRFLAIASFNRQNMEMSQAYFDQAVAAWRRRLAQPGITAAERDTAQKGLDDCLETNAQALVRDGQRLRSERQFQLARERFQKALSVAPSGPSAQTAQVELRNLNGVEPAS